jgi:hypothetical protein
MVGRWEVRFHERFFYRIPGRVQCPLKIANAVVVIGSKDNVVEGSLRLCLV